MKKCDILFNFEMLFLVASMRVFSYAMRRYIVLLVLIWKRYHATEKCIQKPLRIGEKSRNEKNDDDDIISWYTAKWQANFVISSNCWNFSSKNTIKHNKWQQNYNQTKYFRQQKLRGFLHWMLRTHIEMRAFSANAFKPPLCFFDFLELFFSMNHKWPRMCIIRLQNNLNQHRQKDKHSKQFHSIRGTPKNIHWNLGVFTIPYKRNKKQRKQMGITGMCGKPMNDLIKTIGMRIETAIK